MRQCAAQRDISCRGLLRATAHPIATTEQLLPRLGHGHDLVSHIKVTGERLPQRKMLCLKTIHAPEREAGITGNVGENKQEKKCNSRQEWEGKRDHPAHPAPNLSHWYYARFPCVSLVQRYLLLDACNGMLQLIDGSGSLPTNVIQPWGAWLGRLKLLKVILQAGEQRLGVGVLAGQ